MLQLIGLLAISWLLIWLFEKGNLSVLGLTPTKDRLKYFTILLVVTAVCCSSGFFMRMYFAQEKFELNQKTNISFILAGIWVTLKSVLFEELLCRGVGLYILIKKMGQRWAILVSAIIFGLLHWLNGGVFGNGLQMLIVFTYTFTFGLVLAYAFAKSFSLYWPIAMHFGWNLTQNFIFPEKLSDNTLFVSVLQPLVTVSYFVYFSILLFPKISAIVVDCLIIKKHTQIEQPQ
jgi:membrane protease YdiL (CAAX protease family)